MKKYILFVALFTCLMTGCVKEEVLSKTDLLTQKSWVFTAIRSQTNGGNWTDEFSSFTACEKDNTVTFTSSGSYIVDEGATKCRSTDPQVQESGTWRFTTNETKISIGSTSSEVWSVLQLDANVLKIQVQSTSGTTTYTTEATFGHL